jgi:hypothetical protein
MAGTKTGSEPKTEPMTNAGVITQPEAKTEPVSRRDIAALLKTPLGDVLLTGLLNNPDDAGRLIAQRIIQTEARTSAENTPETTPKLKPEANAKTPPALAPKAAE